ncbi:nascent polypeptide-associated complex subunit alpha, muscle-specific form-like isoform X2 [Watersipora subatra]|uniref:nascent polypeptide-associated complex subunit alpha, muscle-specific form-like isoform X2 n=1 Tax=Watersipora subatra TaxID=2589382 RepID=UPI00355C76BE
MIDLKTSADPVDPRDREPTPASAMDNDWYYKWLLFSHFQHQGWQRKMLSAASQNALPLEKSESICGFCEAVGANVKQSLDTTTRILQALNLSKPELNERIGLCNKCEHQIKLLEEAANIRENLTESLLSNLKHLSTSTEAQPSPNGIVANGQSPHFRLAQTLQQRTNEITPQQHSMKRKMTGITNCTPETQLYRQRQIKHLTDKPLELAPNSVTCIEPANSSDEENALMINEPSLSVSPHSSCGSYTPPPFFPSTSQQNTATLPQVLSDVTCSRKRRKQARPAKASGEVVPAVLPAVTRSCNASLSVPLCSAFSASSQKPVSPAVKNPASPSPLTHAVASRTSSDVTIAPTTSSVVSQAAVKAIHKLALDPKLHSAHLAAAQNMASHLSAAMPFNYSSFYQNNISDIFSPQSANSAASALLAQSICKAAANPLMSVSGLLPKGFTLPSNSPSFVNRPSHPKIQPKGAGLLSAKKEPKLPPFPMRHIGSPVQSVPHDGNGLDSSTSPKVHKLIKTDKRRYCKVCAASLRKANNGRPPQSRFLCEPCNLPMCRSCIEEHRMKGEDDKTDVKSSASAKLLQAVKMKDKAAGDSSKPSPIAPNSKSVSSSMLSAPPSHSSVIFGSPVSNMFTSSTPTITALPSVLPSLPLQLPSTPLDMRLPTYKPIAPAPPCSSTPDERSEQDDDEEKPLVIAEAREEITGGSDALQSDQTAITPEVASKTVAMLLPMEHESSSSMADVETGISQGKPSFQAISQLPANSKTCAPVESSIPLQHCPPSVV